MPEVLMVLLFILVVNLFLISWAISDLMKRKQFRLLPKIGWIIVIALVIFGSVPYLLFGRQRENLQG